MGKALNVSRWVLPALAVAVVAAVGCGVSDATEGMFASSGDPGGSGGATTTTSTNTSTSTGTVNPTTSGGGQGQGGTGGAGTGGSGTGGAGGTGGGPITGITLACHNAGDCLVPPSSACCWYNGPQNQDTGTCIQGPPDQATCNTSPNFPEGYRTRIECQLPSHCPQGTVCCGNFVQGQYYADVTCQADCNSVTLCDGTYPDPAANPACQPGEMCQQSGSLPQGYFICRN